MATAPVPTEPRPAGLVPDASTVAIAAYADLRARLSALMAETDPEVAASTVVPACPQWTVLEAFAHVVGITIDIVDGNMEGVATAPWADSHVSRFASLGVDGLLERWEQTAPVIDSLAGLIPDATASQFVFDACTHEHDIRGALGRPGARDSAAVHVALGFVETMLVGQVESAGLPSLLIDLGTEQVHAGPLPTSISVSATPFELLRSFGGRRSVAQIQAMAWTGDPGPYLDLFERSPLEPPAADLVEPA